MRRLVVTLLGGLLLGLLGLTAPAHATGVGEEGCTPGYWKNHLDSWEEASPEELFSSKFNGGTSGVLAGKTLLNALEFGGGPGVAGAEMILARAATATFLNAAHDGLGSPWRRYDPGVDGRPPLVSTVRAALLSGDRSTMLELATRLDSDNNLGCVLN